MQTSHDAKAVSTVLAEMGNERPGDEASQFERGEPDNEERIIYVYPLEGGGVVLTDTPIEEDQPVTPVEAGGEPRTDQRLASRKGLLNDLPLLLLLLLSIVLGSTDTTLFTPSATITIIPQHEITTTAATFPIGLGANNVQGRALPPLTLSQSQTVAATGTGHQDAGYANGQVTFYNGQLQSVVISRGTVLTGRDDVQLAVSQDIVIPAADPSTSPPAFGQATISALALRAGANGNIQALDISGSCCAASIIVKNLAPFAGGRDERNFVYVTGGDIQRADQTLTPPLLRSEEGALGTQLQPGEILTTPACTSRVLANHRPGDEAVSVQVTASETCTAVAYNQASLETAAFQFARGQRSSLSIHYRLMSALPAGVRAVVRPNGLVSLSATLHGVWVYQLDERRIRALVTGRHRLDALRLLSALAGVQTANITGIPGNEQLPGDAAHIHIVLLSCVHCSQKTERLTSAKCFPGTCRGSGANQRRIRHC